MGECGHRQVPAYALQAFSQVVHQRGNAVGTLGCTGCGVRREGAGTGVKCFVKAAPVLFDSKDGPFVSDVAPAGSRARRVMCCGSHVRRCKPNTVPKLVSDLRANHVDGLVSERLSVGRVRGGEGMEAAGGRLHGLSVCGCHVGTDGGHEVFQQKLGTVPAWVRGELCGSHVQARHTGSQDEVVSKEVGGSGYVSGHVSVGRAADDNIVDAAAGRRASRVESLKCVCVAVLRSMSKSKTARGVNVCKLTHKCVVCIVSAAREVVLRWGHALVSAPCGVTHGVEVSSHIEIGASGSG